MTDETVHLAIVEVDSEQDADVSLHGSETNIAELREIVDEDTLLQSRYSHWEEVVDAVDVEVEPHGGFAAYDPE